MNLILDSLSGIDGDLLLDVEPARPAVPGRPARVFSWQRWASVAAVLVVLFVTAFIIRQVLWGGASMMDKAQIPREAEDSGGFNLEVFPQAPEETLPLAEGHGDPKLEGDRRGTFREISALADRTAASFLSAEGAADRIYSPAGLYHSQAYLLHPADRGQTADSLSALGRLDQPFFSLSNCLLVPSDDIPAVDWSLLLYGGAEAFSIQVLRTAYLPDDCMEGILSGGDLPENGCPPNQPQAAALDSRVLLQRFYARLPLDVIAGAGETIGGVRYETIPEAACYSRFDQTVVAEIPAGGGTLYLVLPGGSMAPEEVLQTGGLFAWLGNPPGESEPRAVRLPLFSVSQDHDWLGQDSLLEPGHPAGEEYSLSMVRQRAVLEWEARPAQEQAPGLRVIDFNRPFIFVFVDHDGLTLATGVIRSPFS